MVDFAQLQEIARDRLEQDRLIESVEAVGPTLETAVFDAAALLDVPVRRLEYEIIERGSPGFWGMGKKDWRIQAYERLTTKKKKHLDDFLFDEADDGLPVVQDRDGQAFVQLRSGGEALLKVTAPVGNGNKTTEAYAMQLLAGRNITDIDADLVSKTVKEALGVYIKVGDFDHHSYNDSVVRAEISDTEMQAFMQVTAPGENGCDLPYDEYINALK
jgi:predicted RNA-binding protein Jag